MRIFILPVPTELQPPALRNVYPQHNKKDYGIEQDFLKYLEQNPRLITTQFDTADWHYLPVYWTRYQHRLIRQEFFQQQVSKVILNEEKTFTVCQHADGTLADLGRTIQFLASSKGEGIDIPLVSYSHETPSPKPAKRWLASFIGKLRTHPIRFEMQNSLGRRKDVDIQDGNKGSAFFAKQMLQSYIALCPRGYGCTSFRLYEAMQLGIVPLFISDIDNRPFKTFLDWDQASFYTGSIEGAENILNSYSIKRLLQMGKSAKTMWYQDLMFGKWCRYVFKELEVLK